MKRNKVKNIAKVVLSVMLVCGMASCTDNFEEINKHPYQPSDEEMEGDNFKLGAFFPQMQVNVIPAQENDYQMCENLLGGGYGRYLTHPQPKWTTMFAFFNANESWIYYPYSVVFPRIYGAFKTIKDNTGGEGTSYAWAQILKVAAIHRMTDIYGPIPYSKVSGSSIAAEYDRQEEVYYGMIKELTDAIDVLTPYVLSNPEARPMAEFDMVYGGDYVKWVKFANSLKLRMAVRMSYAAPADAKKYAEEAVNHVIGVMSDNNDNAFISYSKNPIEVMWNAYGDTRVCAEIVAYMNGYEDPRRDKYFQETTKLAENGFYGVRTGISLALTSGSYLDCSAPKVSSSEPLMWMNAAECYFLRAEGAMRGWNMKMDAKTAYETGIATSFAQYGLAGQEVAYMHDDTKVPATYVDPLNSSNSEAINSTITIKWNEEASEEEKLERIITQKWIAMWPLGTEAWAEQRRTGYPAFLSVEVNNSGDASLSEDLASRVPFPPSEALNNTVFYNDAVQKLGGADNYATKLWWDKKNN